MSKKYFIQNKSNGINTNEEWIEMNGVEFYEFINSSKAKGRYFIKLPPLLKNDDFIIIEATKAQYQKWRKELRHNRHLREYGTEGRKYTIVSYHAMETEDGCYGEEMLPDENINIEAEIEMIMALENLADALIRLTAAERWLIDEFYTHEKDQPDIASFLGITQQAVSKRTMRIIKKLRKLMNLKI